MYEIYVEHNPVISSNVTINCNQIFNEIKHNLKCFDYEHHRMILLIIESNCLKYRAEGHF